MKVTFEFDTCSENFEPSELEIQKQAGNMVYCLSKILDKLRYWYKHDERAAIPVNEVFDTIVEIINVNVDMERMGY